MRWRGLFFISLGLNFVLAAIWLAARSTPPSQPAESEVSEPTVKTNLIVRRQFFTWGQVEAEDYPTYIANLRSISCPEQTIRDIIIADVNTLFAQRLATELVTPEQQWWRSRPDSNVVRVATQKARQIEMERRSLLTSLLGANWETGDLLNLPRPSRPGVALDGPVLGVLPMDVKKTVEEIAMQSQERLEAFRAANAQRDPATQAAELAKLREDTRRELAKVLSPRQLEEYLLRYSQNASNLRSELGALRHFSTTPEEFRALFRATDLIDQQLQALAGRTDPNANLERTNLAQQRENAMRTALGPTRYDEMIAMRDAAYREAYAAAQNAGAPEAAGTFYEINEATRQEIGRINANTNLTAAQRAVALKEIELRQTTASALALGENVPDLPSDEPPVPPMPIDPTITRNLRTHAYMMNRGDTPASIAMKYGVSLSDLQAANPNVDLKRIKVGDMLAIPQRTHQ